MIVSSRDSFLELKKIISREKKIIRELEALAESKKSDRDRTAIEKQAGSLKSSLEQENKKIPEILSKIHVKKVLNNKANEKEVEEASKKTKKIKKEKVKPASGKVAKELEITKLDMDVIKRLSETKKETMKKEERKLGAYVRVASRRFSKLARSLIERETFDSMIRDLLKTNMGLVPTAYISVMFFTTLLVGIGAVFIALYFLLFETNLVPFSVSLAGDITPRIIKSIWIIPVLPIITFVAMYFYPSIEKRSIERSINQELPFAAINMSAIAGSVIEPTNIFTIIISTGEYPHLKREFTKVINEINIYGHDLVTALRNSAAVSPSRKISELYNGLATTITSGGNLAEFLDKRAESLLLDYRLERERYTKTAETFIDIYISVVIAAPMILMLLLMMMQISGLGISLSASTISLIMIFGVGIINFIFLTFLHLRQPKQ
jgi:hypothetical protein